MNTATNLDATIATIRAAGAAAGRTGHGQPHEFRHLAIWGTFAQVLRACAAVGLSRELASAAERGDYKGGTETMRTWTLSDIDGRVVGRLIHVDGAERACADVDNAYTNTPICFAA